MNFTKITAMLLSVLAVLSLCACGGSSSVDEYLQQHDIVLESSNSDLHKVSDTDAASEGDAVSGGDVSDADVTTTTTVTTTTAAPPKAGALPESFIGSWAVIDIYQEAVASDISADEALRREQMNGISFGSSYFDRSGESVSDAVFVVNENATYADMEKLGIRTEPLIGPYGSDAKIVSVEVRTADGLTCTTVFLINDMTLVAFGSGMNVFTYELMNAVG